MRIRLLCVLSLVAAPLVPLALNASASAATGSTPDWTVPVKLDSGGAEPSIRVAPDGRSAAYVSAPSGLGSNFWRIDEKVDSNGLTTLTPSAGVQPDQGTGGGDAEISVGTSVDPKTGCAPIAYSGLHNIDLLDNFTVARSLDCGKTFSLLNPYGTQNTLTDRQWQTFDGIKTNHLLYHKVDTGQIVDSRSEDGGQTYLTLGTAAGATGVVDPAHSYTIQNLKIGNVVTDLSRPVESRFYPISGEQVHTLWATFGGSRDAADAAAGQAGTDGFDHIDTIYVARSDDGGVSWTDVTSFSTAPTEKRELDLIFPVLAVDKRGKLYSAWTDGNLIQYVSSSDAGKTWTKPFTVNPGEAGAKKLGGTADLFPWIAAGGDGRLDVVWYHGEGGDTSGYRNVGTADTKWTVAFAQLTNAAGKDAAGVSAPTVAARDLAITPVMHTGNVCNNGTVCGITDTGDRTLLDFFQVAIDGQGRANIAYAADQGSAGTAHIEYVRQNSGLSLINGAAVTPNEFPGAAGTVCTPDGTVVDPAGDATGAALVDSTPTPSQDDLDVVRAFLTTGGTADAPTITTHVKVKDLTTTGGQYFRFYFSYGTAEYLTTASRSVAGAEAYNLSANGATGATSLKAITGTFNPVKDEITTTFSAADFNSTAKPKAPLATGSVLGGLQVLAQRSAGVGATLTSDTASGLCPYVVGTAPAAAAGPTAAASSAPASPAGSAAPGGCPSTAPSVRINGASTINATGRASVTVTGAASGSTVELQGYSQNHRGTATFGNDPTPVDRTGKADNSGSITFDDLMPASNTRLQARQTGCPNGGSVVLEVRAQETLAVTRTGTRAYTFSGKSIPAREGGLIVTLYRIVGQPCAAGVDPSKCPGEKLLRQARADATTGQYAMSVTFGPSDQNVRDEFVVKTGRDAQNAPGRSNTRSLLIS